MTARNRIIYLQEPVTARDSFGGSAIPLVRATNRNESITLAETRDALLPKLLSGELQTEELER
jgi:hypothetical protein